MISKNRTDITFANNKVVLDISEYTTISVQVIGGSGTISLLGTNDPGDVTGSTEGGPKDAANFNAVQATNLSTGATVTAITGTNVFKIDPVAFKYLQIGDGSTAAATKIIFFGTKPY